jgi:hypothetical protein
MRGPCKAGLIALLLPLLSSRAIACSLENPAEYVENAAALAQRFWFASIVLAGLIPCLDLWERRVSLALPVAGWLLFSWGLLIYRTPTPGYLSDCTVPLAEYSQYVLGITSVLLGCRALMAWRTSDPNCRLR